jgi:ABC-2 type transport system permease protein
MSAAVANIKTIAKRELGGYFASPVAYVFIVIFLLLCGFFTFMLGGFSSAARRALSRSFVASVVVSVPRACGGHAPVVGGTTPWHHGAVIDHANHGVAGDRRKVSASWLFLGLALLLTFPVVWTVNYLGNADNGVIFCGYVGSLLLAGAYLAVSCLTSAMTRNQVISFIISVVICLFLILAGWPPVTNLLVRWAPEWLVSGVAAFSVIPHFDGFQRGVLDTRDLIFFLSIIGFSLFATGVVIRNLRSGH